MRALPVPPTAPRLLVATPSGERHAVGAALAAATAALEGWGVVYLGADVPAADIAAAAKASGANAVALSIVYADDVQGTEREIDALSSALGDAVPLMLGGAGASLLDLSRNSRAVRVFGTLGELKVELERF
jgi:MerR family transcriptional regulator, light-induced transcriptional regulator